MTNTINDTQKEALTKYISMRKDLTASEIVKNGTVDGDVGEFLAKRCYPKIILSENGREKGYDGKDGKKLIQIKFHNALKGTNLILNYKIVKDKKPYPFDDLIIIIGPNSNLYPEKHIGICKHNDFLVYKIESFFDDDNNLKTDDKSNFKAINITKTFLNDRKPKFKISSKNFEITPW